MPRGRPFERPSTARDLYARWPARDGRSALALRGLRGPGGDAMVFGFMRRRVFDVWLITEAPCSYGRLSRVTQISCFR